MLLARVVKFPKQQADFSFAKLNGTLTFINWIYFIISTYFYGSINEILPCVFFSHVALNTNNNIIII